MYKGTDIGKKSQIEHYQAQINESQRVIKGRTQVGQTSNIATLINIFYLRDKILEHKVLHERFEALTIIWKQRRHQSFVHMMKQMIERIDLVIDGDPIFHPILDEIFKLVANLDNLTILD
jgi:hypothetical protein